MRCTNGMYCDGRSWSAAACSAASRASACSLPSHPSLPSLSFFSSPPHRPSLPSLNFLPSLNVRPSLPSLPSLRTRRLRFPLVKGRSRSARGAPLRSFVRSIVRSIVRPFVLSSFRPFRSCRVVGRDPLSSGLFASASFSLLLSFSSAPLAEGTKEGKGPLLLLLLRLRLLLLLRVRDSLL